MKRGQAALEFLTTYGWAFLIILVMIGAMYYFGWVDVDSLLPQKCKFSEAYCSKYALDGNGVANFKLKNSLPDRIFISKIEWSTPNDNEWFDCTTQTLGNENIGDGGEVFNSDATEDFSCASDDLDTYLVSDDKQRVKIRISYNEGTSLDEDYVKYLKGDIHADVR